ncbi:MAG: hypothetical protein IPH08_04965 [Rhodocyclaceae bacterium]|nr:hypothetical protein [Rhodocyclaceae bacterium]
MWPLTPLNQALSIAILLLSLALGASMLHGRALKAERDEKIAEIDYMAREAQAFNERSNAIARQTNEQHIALVESAKKTAYANYLKKYGDNAACGISVRLPNMPADPSEASSAPSDHAAESVGVLTRDFLDRASEAAVMIQACQQFVVKNDLEVE